MAFGVSWFVKGHGVKLRVSPDQSGAAAATGFPAAKVSDGGGCDSEGDPDYTGPN